jgi:hypothetical protein
MHARRLDPTTDSPWDLGGDVPFPRRDADVAELALLLPTWQIAALECAARTHGLTTAQMLRRWISDLLAKVGPAPAAPSGA